MNVLIVAPASYVGRQLLVRFQREAGARVRVLAADVRPIERDLRPDTEVIEGDLLRPDVLRRAARGIDIAYYPGYLTALDRSSEAWIREFTRRFRDACIEAGVKRIVHLGNSPLRGRSGRSPSATQDTTDTLGACPARIQSLCFSPGIIIGPGSAAYEMVMGLVQRLPMLPLPRWTRAEVRPLALSDAIEYLVHAASLEVSGPLVMEIGAPSLRLSDVLQVAARVTRRSRVMIPIPLTVPRLSATLVTFATGFSYALSLEFVRSLSAAGRRSSDPSTDDARRYFPEISPLTCEEAMTKALAATGANEVKGRWTDSLAGVSYRTSEADLRRARYRDLRSQEFGDIPPSRIFRSVLALGGEAGWFSFDILWRIRGLIDKLLGGFGTSLGRRSPMELRTGDMLDVWRVVDLVENQRVLLEAQMKVFGRAWLEFRLRDTSLIQTAYYEPSGVLGTIYWHAMLPFHRIIFPDMARSIVRRARGPS